MGTARHRRARSGGGSSRYRAAAPAAPCRHSGRSRGTDPHQNHWVPPSRRVTKLRKTSILSFPLDLQLLFHSVIPQGPRALWGGRDRPVPSLGFAAHPQQHHLTEPRTPQQPGDPEPRDPHHPPHRATTAGPCCRGCPPMGHCPAASKPFVPAGPGLYRALPQPGLEQTSLRVLAQHTPSLEKQRPVPSSPKTPHAQTLPLHTQAEFSPFTQNCLSPSLSLGLIQPFGLGLFLIAGTISVWARNPPFNPPTLFPFQIPGNINSCFSMAPKQATWAGSVLQSC